ncbi:MAG: MerR family transcriptional regulator [Flavobacteriaceae bacterium]|nr:MerR family transcriptional regulator [Flavobacteriaceae bacterium]
MSSKLTSSSQDQYKEQSQPKTEQNIQNIPNRRSLKKTAKKPSVKSASAFRTISEVANELAVQQHVLRFWESKFSYIKPMKRGGGRRYYCPEDVNLLKNIHHLLYSEGYTIKGVQKLLQKTRGNLSSVIESKDSVQTVIKESEPVKAPSTLSEAVDENRDELKSMLDDLKSMRDLIG